MQSHLHRMAPRPLCHLILLVLASKYFSIPFTLFLLMFRPSTIFNSALNYSLALYFIIHPPHWCYSDCLKMQPHPIIMALAKILHQFLKDIWTPLKIFDGNDTLFQNAVAPLLSSDTSVRSSSSLRPLFHADLHSKCCGIHFSFSAAKLLSEPLGIEW